MGMGFPMFGMFQRKLARRPIGSPRVARVQTLLGRLVDQWHTTGYFMGALGADMPRRMTPDGIEVSSDATLLIGVTAAPRAFGIECAHLPAHDLVSSVTTVLSPGAKPEWLPDLGTDGGLVTVLPLTDFTRLRLLCLPCPVDPCFNSQRYPGARLMGHLVSA